MPETAPLDVSEATVGYELDSITLRNIASVRYVRHHEWLNHVLGNPVATQALIPPRLMDGVDTAKIEDRIKDLESEIAELEAEKAKGWSFHVNESKADVLSKAILNLRKDFGNDTFQATKESVERSLGVEIEEANMMRPVSITYDRKAVDQEQAEMALEKAKKDAEEAAKAQPPVPETSSASTGFGGESSSVTAATPPIPGVAAQQTEPSEKSSSQSSFVQHSGAGVSDPNANVTATKTGMDLSVPNTTNDELNTAAASSTKVGGLPAVEIPVGGVPVPEVHESSLIPGAPIADGPQMSLKQFEDAMDVDMP